MLKIGGLLCAVLGLTACVATPQPYDYRAFRAHMPKSILVLPPLNDSPDIRATAGMAVAALRPLAESGYYVFPASLVADIFRENGLTQAHDIHAVSLKKLRQIFGTDAVLYMTVKEYGTSYLIIQSDTRVTAEAKLVDSRSGVVLWQGSATASSTEENQSSNSLISALVIAAVNQVVDSVADRAFDIAQRTGQRLLSADSYHGVMYGHRSPYFEKQPNK